jgi:hypothetical protein
MADRDHRYNNPDLMPEDWLLAVMRDKNVSLAHRMHVAVELLKMRAARGQYDPHPHDREVRLTIRIEGIGNNPPELIPPEPKVKLN